MQDQDAARIPTPEEQPLLDLADTFGPLNIARTTGYLLAARGEYPVPVLRIGSRMKVRTIDFRRYLGLDN